MTATTSAEHKSSSSKEHVLTVCTHEWKRRLNCTKYATCSSFLPCGIPYCHLGPTRAVSIWHWSGRCRAIQLWWLQLRYGVIAAWRSDVWKQPQQLCCKFAVSFCGTWSAGNVPKEKCRSVACWFGVSSVLMINVHRESAYSVHAKVANWASTVPSLLMMV